MRIANSKFQALTFDLIDYESRTSSLDTELKVVTFINTANDLYVNGVRRSGVKANSATPADLKWANVPAKFAHQSARDPMASAITPFIEKIEQDGFDKGLQCLLEQDYLSVNISLRRQLCNGRHP